MHPNFNFRDGLKTIADYDGLLVASGQQGRIDYTGLKDSATGLLKALVDSDVLSTANTLEEIPLDPLVKHVYPIQTPFLNGNLIGQSGGHKGLKYQCRMITAINKGNHSGAADERSSSSSGRGKRVDIQTLPREISYAKLAPEGAVTSEEAELSGDLKAYANATLANLASAKIIEEMNLLFSIPGKLGAVSSLVATASTSGGSLAAATYAVTITPLNYWAFLEFQGFTATADVPAPVANIRNGEGDDASDTGNVLGSTGEMICTWAPIYGAHGYAVYLYNGSTTWLVGVVTSPKMTITDTTLSIPSISFTSAAPVVAAYPTADGSDLDTDGIDVRYSGLWGQINDSTVPGNLVNLNGGSFTTTTGGSGILQWENMFANLYSYRKGVKPTHISVSVNDWINIFSPTLTSSTAQNYRINVDGNAGARISAGVIIDSIKHQLSRDVVDIVVHPLQPDGKVIFYTRDLPYVENNTGVNFTHFYSTRMVQKFYAMTEDLAEPGPWAIRTVGNGFLTWPRACGAIWGY